MKNMKSKQTNKRAIQCLTVLGMAGLCLPAVAQDNDPVDTGEAAPVAEQGATRPPMTFSAGVARQFNTDIDNGGNFSINRLHLGLALPFKIDDQFAVVTKFAYQLDEYDFGGGIPGGWGNINTFTAAGLLQYRHDEKWMFYGGPILRIAAEGSDWSGATKAGGALGVNYTMNDKLSFGGGIIVIGQIKENALVMPILTANWKFADQWSLKLGMTDLATAGYGLTVAYDLNSEWQFAAGAQMHKSRFRIDGSGATANGIGQESSTTLTLSATWSPEKVKGLSATAFAGIAAGGKIEVESSNGTQLRNDTYDPAPVMGAKVSFKF